MSVLVVLRNIWFCKVTPQKKHIAENCMVLNASQRCFNTFRHHSCIFELLQVDRKFNLGWDKETLSSKVSFTGVAEALLFLKPVLDITVYKIFRVAFVFKFGYEMAFSLEASTNFASVECSHSLKKFLTLDVALNVSANLFGNSLFDKEFNLYTNKWKLDEHEGDCSLAPATTLTSTLSLTESGTAQTEDGCACKESWATSEVSCANSCCLLEGYSRHLCIKQDETCGDGRNWGYCKVTTDDGCLCEQSWSSNGVVCHDFCCNLEGFARPLCRKKDPSCGGSTYGYCSTFGLPRARDGCTCQQTWTNDGTTCQDFCCTTNLIYTGTNPVCQKEDPACGSTATATSECEVPRTADGCRCKKVWAAEGVQCNDFCCYLGGAYAGRHLCIKEDDTCGDANWGWCMKQETDQSRRLASCEEVAFFCNENACANQQPDCHRCGYCDNFGTSSTSSSTSSSTQMVQTTLMSPSSTTHSTSAVTTSVSSASSSVFELGSLWRRRIWEDGSGSCSAFAADLVLQLVQFDDFGHGDGILYFMGSTNPVAGHGSCSITMFYEASVRGSLPYSTLKPQSDPDFFGECENFALPYGWVVQIDFGRIHGTDSMNCMHIDLNVVTSNDMTTDPSTSATSTIVETSAGPETTTSMAGTVAQTSASPETTTSMAGTVTQNSVSPETTTSMAGTVPQTSAGPETTTSMAGTVTQTSASPETTTSMAGTVTQTSASPETTTSMAGTVTQNSVSPETTTSASPETTTSMAGTVTQTSASPETTTSMAGTVTQNSVSPETTTSMAGTVSQTSASPETTTSMAGTVTQNSVSPETTTSMAGTVSQTSASPETTTSMAGTVSQTSASPEATTSMAGTVAPTSPLASTTASTTTTTNTTTTTLAEHLVVGADIIMTDRVWIAEKTTWTSADGIRALAVRVEVLPGISLTIEGSRNSSLVLALDDCG